MNGFPHHPKSGLKLGKCAGISVLCTFLALACRPSGASRALTPEIFSELLVDVVKTNRRLRGKPDSLLAARQALLRDYKVTKTDLENWIEQNRRATEVWEQVLEGATRELAQGDGGLPQMKKRQPTERYGPR